MIRNTFLHLPGVGRRTEQRLWQAGYQNWDSLEKALEECASVRALFATARQMSLFPSHDNDFEDPRSFAWRDCLAQSKQALKNREYTCFVELLKPSSHWRLLPHVAREALYLDIETTGLSRNHHYVTVIGALYEGRFHQWVWPQRLDELAELVRAAPVVITFNGARFDIPFLREQIPGFPLPRAHIDLLYSARAAELRGSQKEVEETLGLSRSDDLTGLDGAQAVASWCAALYGDRSEFKRLLKYNRADVEMLPRVGAGIVTTFLESDDCWPEVAPTRIPARSRSGHKPSSFAKVRQSWKSHRPSLESLRPRIVARFERDPVVVGIDLRAKEARPTGWAVCRDATTQTEVLYTDAEILERTLAEQPDLVSIDAPLFLPRGRKCVSDDSPCREKGGIVRDAERILWSRGIRVYPALIKQMQGLTARGIALAEQLRSHGIDVIESYPGAAQDVLNIPRKKMDESLLERGLRQFGYRFRGEKTHDELDAITSALVGHFYLADEFEALGAEDEGHMIVPQSVAMCWNSTRVDITAIIGLPGAGKTTVSRALAQRFGFEHFSLGEELRIASASNPRLRTLLQAGKLAPEPVVCELVRSRVLQTSHKHLILDGFPRHSSQIQLLDQLCTDWRALHLNISNATAIARIQTRAHSAHNDALPHESLPRSARESRNESSASRQEDSTSVATERIATAASLTTALLRDLANRRSQRIVSIDATRPLDHVIHDAASFIGE